jgi:hypothetical protein
LGGNITSNPTGMDIKTMKKNKINAGVQQLLLNSGFINRRFQVSAVFRLYSMFTTVVFGFPYPRYLIYVHMEKSVASSPRDLHFLGTEL